MKKLFLLAERVDIGANATISEVTRHKKVLCTNDGTAILDKLFELACAGKTCSISYDDENGARITIDVRNSKDLARDISGIIKNSLQATLQFKD